MGLIKAAASAIGGTLGDQWEDYITCNELNSDVLIVKKTTKTGQISAKSRIQVNPGQAIIVVDSGLQKKEFILLMLQHLHQFLLVNLVHH